MSTWLIHHGVQGQQWGVRNGPPYPLSRQKGNTKHPANNTEMQGDYKIKKYKDPFMHRVANTLIYNILYNIPVVGDVLLVKTFADKILKRRNWFKKEGAPEKIKDLKKKVSQTTVEEDMKIVNTRKEQNGGTENCINCTIALEMRRRGYDVVARSTGSGRPVSAFKEWYDIKDSDIHKVSGLGRNRTITTPEGTTKKRLTRQQYANEQFNKLMNELESNGNGSRGYIGLCYDGFWSGHAMFWEMSNGTVKIYDGQTGSTKGIDTTISLADPDKYDWIRLDDKKLKPEVTTMIRSNPKTKKR